MKKILLPVMYAFAGSMIAFGIVKFTEKPQVKYIIDKPAASAGNVFTNYTPGAEAHTDFTHAAEISVHSVVHIKTKATRNNPYANHPFYHFFYGHNHQPDFQVEGAGSGVIISPDGYIVTNNHVIENADNIEVVLNNKRNFKAKLIGKDPQTDLALLKIDAQQLSYLPYGNSNEAKIGEWVLAVGNPFNLTSTVTAGIISAKGRNINIINSDPHTGMSPIESFIQTDAAVNPGNSGGALVNTKGELIGINTAIKSNTGSYAGYSFAIPSAIVRKTVADLMEFGQVQRAFIGVSIRDIDEQLAAELGTDSYNGVYINDVSNNGAAEKAGLKKGDVITHINDIPVNNVPELQETVGQFRPGDKVQTRFLRGNKTYEYEVVLRNIDGNTEIVSKEKVSTVKLLGAQLEDINGDEYVNLKVKEGVKVKKLSNGKLKSMGVQEGFIITKIDNTPVKNTEHLSTLMQQKKGGVLIEGVYPDGSKAYYGLGI